MTQLENRFYREKGPLTTERVFYVVAYSEEQAVSDFEYGEGSSSMEEALRHVRHSKDPLRIFRITLSVTEVPGEVNP